MAGDPRKQFAQAVKLYQAGRVGEAEQLCRRILARAPAHVDTLHLAGVIALQGRDAPLAIRRLQQAALIAPRDALLLTDYGNALAVAGRNEEAEACFRRVVTLEPGLAQGRFNLGNFLARQGRLEEAVASYRRAIELGPGFLEARMALAAALKLQGRPGEAEQALRDALARASGHPQLLISLGSLFSEMKRFPEAEPCYRQAIESDPRFALAHLNLGHALRAQKRQEEALQCVRKAVDLAPELAEAHCALGDLFQDRKEYPAAISAYRRAVALCPDYGDGHFNLGNALRKDGQTTEALHSFARAVELNPAAADAWTNLSAMLMEHDRFDEAVDASRSAAALDPDDPTLKRNLFNALAGAGRRPEAIAALREQLRVHPNAELHSWLLQFLSYEPEVSPEMLYRAHLEWARLHAPEPIPGEASKAPEASPARRLRIGYVSADFRAHSVSHFIAPVLANHDRSRFEVYCYSNSDIVDPVTRRLHALAEHWEQVVELGDSELADHIRADGIDILVDLAGHTGGNRLPVLAKKPAPIQVNWLGYNNTTGMRQVGYRLTDALADPVGEPDRFHTETLVRLPDCFCCYEPPPEAPEVGPLPSAARGAVTFGCFNNPAKLNLRVLEVWGRILAALPGSRLLLKGRGLSGERRRHEILEPFLRLGVAAQRVQFLTPLGSQRDHLAAYNEVDVALDPFPYNGVTTTCEALWMGVPVVVLAGRDHRGRVGTTLLSHAGYPQWVARSEDEYAAIAIGLASELDALVRARAGLREALRRSPLMDAAVHTRAVEAAYWEMWRRFYGVEGG